MLYEGNLNLKLLNKRITLSTKVSKRNTTIFNIDNYTKSSVMKTLEVFGTVMDMTMLIRLAE